MGGSIQSIHNLSIMYHDPPTTAKLIHMQRQKLVHSKAPQAPFSYGPFLF